MTKYEIILYWSVEDEVFIAEVPAAIRLRGRWQHAHSGFGECGAVIQEWIETARELAADSRAKGPTASPKRRLAVDRAPTWTI